MPADINSVRSAIVAAASAIMGGDEISHDLNWESEDETFLRLAAALDAIDGGKHAYDSRTAASEAQERLMDAVQEGR